jgi:spore maturation protein CgeB
MKFVIFGVTISSSWGNGHATLWRGLCKALARRGHRVFFFERDVLYYALNRDLTRLPHGELCLYASWEDALPVARWYLADADVAMVTSYCPDGVPASEAVLESPAAVRTFYDLDAPVTLARLEAGEAVEYIGPRGLVGFDLVLSYTGGRALTELQARLGARRVAPLYGSVDPDAYHRTDPVERYRADLSYLGTYAADRQPALEEFLVEPARRLPGRRFVIGGPNTRWSFPGPATSISCDTCRPASIPAFTARRGSPRAPRVRPWPGWATAPRAGCSRPRPATRPS